MLAKTIAMFYKNFTAWLSLFSGVPALSLPVDLSSRGLPIGLQLIASCFSDKKLLMVAKWLEQQVNFPRHKLDEEIEAIEKKR